MQATLQVSQGGRIVIPAKMRQALGLGDGSRMVATMDPVHRTLRLVPLEDVLDAIQAEAGSLLAAVPNLAGELVGERRHGEGL